MTAVIRPVGQHDADAIARIYNHYIAHSIITFEEQAVDSAEMRDRVNEIAEANLPWLVAELDGEVAGYAYASKWKGRCAYRFSAEVTVYVDSRCARQGIGSALYAELLPALKRHGVHAALGGIALPNDASVQLHEKFGFAKVAHFKETGFKFGKWIDVGYWECLL